MLYREILIFHIVAIYIYKAPTSSDLFTQLKLPEDFEANMQRKDTQKYIAIHEKMGELFMTSIVILGC